MRNRKGSTLIEVIAAIAIISLIAIPIALYFVSSAKINSTTQAKSEATNIASSVIETLQAVDVSDFLSEINGYDTDAYGTELDYTLCGDTLCEYTVQDTYEATYTSDKYVPVTKQEDVGLDYLVESSIKTRQTTNGVTKTYFTGNEEGKYYTVLQNVKGEGLSYDILATIEKSSDYSLADVNSMSRSDVESIYESESVNADVAATFVERAEMYKTLSNDSSFTVQSAEWFMENWRKEYTITLKKDTITESVSVSIDCTYIVPSGSVGNYSETLSENIGSFTTNSTTEVAEGIYFYYFPLTDSDVPRNIFTINNKNELGTTIYLVASGVDSVFFNSYHPELHIYELSDAIYSEEARTSICSNVPDANWTKTVDPARVDGVTVKTLSNETESHAMYTINIDVYRHRNASFDTDGAFVPNEELLLTTISGSFLDASQVYDLGTDVSTGLTVVAGVATYSKQRVVYDGTEKTGIIGSGVSYDGIYKATDVGTYTAYITPLLGYTWNDGTNTEKKVEWEIERSPEARVDAWGIEYSGEEQTGVTYSHCTISGITKATDAGTYIATAVPEANYAWSDGTYGVKTAEWTISPKQVSLSWGTSDWIYDGAVHTATCECLGVLDSDICYANLVNDTIQYVGTREASVQSLSNSNYTLPDSGTTQTLIIHARSETFVTYNASYKYDGTEKNAIVNSLGVVFSGTITATDSGTYVFYATPDTGYAWSDTETDESREFVWEITKKEVFIEWSDDGDNIQWTYDGEEHSVSCTIKDGEGNLVEIDPIFEDNSITDVGTVTATITGFSNNNYYVTGDCSKTLTVIPACDSTYTVTNVDYDGKSHFCVEYDYCEVTETDGPQTNAGTYYVTLTPVDNHAWIDGTTDSKTVEWEIRYITEATFSVTDVYMNKQTDGTNKTQTGVKGTNVDFDSESVLSASELGTYSYSVTPAENYAWSDGTRDTKSGTWSVLPATACLYATMDYFYDGSTFTAAFYDEMGVYSVDNALTSLNLELAPDPDTGSYGITSSSKIGEYTFWVKPMTNFATWEDGTSTVKEVNWYIYLECTVTLPDYSSLISSDPDVSLEISSNVLNSASSAVKEEIVNNTTASYTYNYFDENFAGLSSRPSDVGQYYYNATPVCDIYCEGLDSFWTTVCNDSDPNPYVYVEYEGTVNRYTSVYSEFSITVPAGVTLPTAKTDLIYSGADQELINAGTGTGTFTYSTDGENYSTAIPTGNNAGDYTVYCIYTGTEGDCSCSLTITIDKADATITPPTPKTLTYTGSALTLINKGTASGGTMYYSLNENGSYSYNSPTGTVAKTYTVYYKVVGDSNHNDYKSSISVTIDKADPTVTATPTAKTKLTYNGYAQTLIYVGTASGGTMRYSLSVSGTYSSAPPTGTAVGTYTVYYKVVGDSNHNDTTPIGVLVTIAKADSSVTKAPTAKSLTYTGKALTLIDKGTAFGGTMCYSLSQYGTYSSTPPTGTAVGRYTVYYKVVGDSNHNDTDPKYVTSIITK